MRPKQLSMAANIEAQFFYFLGGGCIVIGLIRSTIFRLCALSVAITFPFTLPDDVINKCGPLKVIIVSCRDGIG